MQGVHDKRERPKPPAVQGRAGGPENTGRDVHSLRLEKEPPEHRRELILHGGSLGRQKRAVDCKTGRGRHEPFRKRERAGVRFFQEGVLQLCVDVTDDTL